MGDGSATWLLWSGLVVVLGFGLLETRSVRSDPGVSVVRSSR